ncbi:helix-turn-helix domain-containing protein [Ferdinandcohnia sp. SAFN-114]|uniref:helix-turn-helix domain-containing protein n=1 Tax=Ferdinandcohnia sp. SAFN-114 TaxID=3387275 RepID=UPI003F7F2609
MKRRKWTKEEIDFLYENVGYMKVPTIAEKLERTEQAVVIKMKRLGIAHTRNQAGYLTTQQLAELLKVDPKTVRQWALNHDLKCVIKATRFSRKFYFIHPEDFWSWAEKNREKVDFSKIEPKTILPEPDWVAAERKIKKDINYKIWTVKEEKDLLMMMSSGYSLRDVASILERSEISIQKKYKRLRIN